LNFSLAIHQFSCSNALIAASLNALDTANRCSYIRSRCMALSNLARPRVTIAGGGGGNASVVSHLEMTQ
jgi:hypothetical protein